MDMYNYMMLVCYFIFVAIVFLLIAVKIPTTLPAITNKPVVESVTVINKDTDYGGGKFSKSQYYTLFFLTEHTGAFPRKNTAIRKLATRSTSLHAEK